MSNRAHIWNGTFSLPRCLHCHLKTSLRNSNKVRWLFCFGCKVRTGLSNLFECLLWQAIWLVNKKIVYESVSISSESKQLAMKSYKFQNWKGTLIYCADIVKTSEENRVFAFECDTHIIIVLSKVPARYIEDFVCVLNSYGCFCVF